MMKNNYKIGVEYKDDFIYLETFGLSIIGKKEVRSILPCSNLATKKLIMTSIFTNIVNESLSIDIKSTEDYELFGLTVRFEQLEDEDTYRLIIPDENGLFPEEEGCNEQFTHQYDKFILRNGGK